MRELKVTDDELDMLHGALVLQSCCNGVYCVSSYEKALNGDKEELDEYKFHGHTFEQIKEGIAPLLSVMEKVKTLWE